MTGRLFIFASFERKYQVDDLLSTLYSLGGQLNRKLEEE